MNALDTSKVFLDLATYVLQSGHHLRLRAGGGSMWPTIQPGEAITVEPANETEVKLKDIVLYRTGRGLIGHRVVGIAAETGSQCRWRGVMLTKAQASRSWQSRFWAGWSP
jgi:hypothetical protein